MRAFSRLRNADEWGWRAFSMEDESSSDYPGYKLRIRSNRLVITSDGARTTGAWILQMVKDHVADASPDFRAELLARLREAAPEAFAEGKLDVEKLKVLLGDAVETRPERYEFNWAGKRDAIAMLQAPTRATLVPDRAASVDFDSAQNVFIEGENLEVLKALYRSYFGRVKLIYIDPPYNTQGDFIYPDNFADPLEQYLHVTGQKNGDGDLLTSHPERNGRYHSSWLSMMYPRLSLARQMLHEAGFILISIDDHEITSLRRLCDEVLGEENFIAQMVWEKGRKNDAKLFSIGHEYILIYAKSLSTIKERNTVWREEKPGAKEIWEKYLTLRELHGNDDKKIEGALSAWYRDLPKTHPSKKWSRYKRIDVNGPWRDRDISWPGGEGPTYDVLHPKTGRPCKVPDAGWRYATPDEMQRQIKLGLVEFRDDHTEPPFRKAHIRPIPDELINDEPAASDDDVGSEEEFATQVRGTYFYKQSQVAVRNFRDLMGSKVFDNPKDPEELGKLFKYICGADDKPIIVDFFAGSGASAEAVIQLNANGNVGMRFIAVQLPEPCNPKERSGKAALKAGLATVADIASERIRRALKSNGLSGQGFGLRAFRLAPSSTRQWTGVEENTPDAYGKQLEVFSDSLLSGWRTENVIWEVAVREGYSLTAAVAKLEAPKNGSFWSVVDADKDQSFTITLDDALTLEAVRALGLGKDDLFICRDTALDDTLAANLALQCHLKVI